MPDLITVANDLKNMPDQWLAQQMTNPSGTVPPWLVASEVQRREKLRSGASKAQAPQSSVSQDLIKSLFAKIPPTAGLGPPTQGPGNAPPGMPPVNLTPPAAGPGSAPPGGPPMGRMPGTPGMAKGGRVRYATGSAVEDDYLAPSYDDEMSALYPDEEEGDGGRPSAFGSRVAPARAPAAPDYDTYIAAASKKYNLPPEILRKQIKAESNGNPKAVSGKGARGAMQIMPDTARGMGLKDLNQLDDPAVNIDLGARYLRQMLDRYQGDMPKALAAYNAGPGAVEKNNAATAYPETRDYVQKVMNADRQRLGLQPTTTPPPILRSRLLEARPPELTSDQKAAQATAEALNQRARQNGGTLPPEAAAAAPPPPPPAAVAAVTPPAPAAPPVAPKPTPLHQTWTPPEDAGVKGLQERIAAFQSGHQPLDQRLQELYGAKNIEALNAGAKMVFGERRDYGKYEQALDEMMAAAKKRMHPSIGDSLIAFGSALMANKNHNFGVAAGEATQHAFGVMQLLQQQGTKDYLEATRAGIALQDKIDDYNTKVGQYKMQRLGAQQSGAITDERTYQNDLAHLQNQIVTAKTTFDAKMATPAVQQNLAMAILNEHGIQLDPQINDPMKQLIATGNREWVEQAQNAGKAAASVKAPPIPEQQMDSAVRRTLQGKGLPLPPTNRLATMQDAPLELHDAISKLAGDMGAQKTIAVQEGVANVAAESMDPEFIGQYIVQHGALPPGLSRNPLLSAKAWNMGAQWAKKNGLSNQEMFMQQNGAKAAQGALEGLTKTTANVEAFSKLADMNMKALEQSAAKVKDLGIPVFNTPLRDWSQQWGGNKDISDMKVNLATVRAELARVLNTASGTGEITLRAKEEMDALLGDNMTYEMLVSALNRFRQEMGNRREVYARQLQDLKEMTIVGGVKQPGAPAGGGQYRNLMKRGDVTIGIGADNKWHNVATGEIVQ